MKQLGGRNSTFMLDKPAVCRVPLSEQSYFLFDFAHLFIHAPKLLKKDFLNHTGPAITLVMILRFF